MSRQTVAVGLLLISWTVLAGAERVDAASRQPLKVRPAAVTVEAVEAKAGTAEAKIPVAIKFKDLKPADPAFPYVLKMVVSYEAIAGYPDGTFRGNKTISRAEFAKVLTKALDYLEKKYGLALGGSFSSGEVAFKDLPASHWSYPAVARLVGQYKLISGYPDGTFRPVKTISRFELATVLAKTVRLIYARSGAALPTGEAVKLQDVKADHWAMNDIQQLLKLGIMDAAPAPIKKAPKVKARPNKKKLVVAATPEAPSFLFRGNAQASRFEVTIAGARLIDRAESAGGKLSPSLGPLPPSRVERALLIPQRPQGSVSSGWGNVYESASGTNNWLGYNSALGYGDTFKLWSLAGNYELTGKYGYNQIFYLTPGSGGAVNGAIANENRYELELNTIYPVADLWGISGKLLLGAKYINLSNQVAPTNFTGFNAGLVTAAKLFGRNCLLRGFWSLPLARASVSPSVLGQPAQLFDYEASIDQNLFSYPVLLGLSGEMMTFTNTGSRYYNMAFVRYFLF